MEINKAHILPVIIVSAMLGLTAFQCSEVDDDEEHLCGAYTEQRAITAEELEIFTSVVGTIDTATEYTPLTVATQVVAGLNYKFYCRYDDKTGAAPGYCFVIIYQPLQGEPQLSGIEKQ